MSEPEGLFSISRQKWVKTIWWGMDGISGIEWTDEACEAYRLDCGAHVLRQVVENFLEYRDNMISPYARG